jgi:flagellar biosynthetic protein FliR
MTALDLTADQFTGLLLTATRATAWIVAVPWLSQRTFPAWTRICLSVAIALACTPAALHHAVGPVPHDLAGFLTEVAYQAATGLFLGLGSALLLSAAEAAGSMVDYASGLAYSAVVDPTTGQAGSVFSRMFNLAFTTLAFATDAHHRLIEGFAASFTATPLGRAPVFGAADVGQFALGISTLVRAALEIAGPLVGVLLLTDVVPGLAAKFVPQANILSVGLPAKALVAMTSTGLALSYLPVRLGALVDQAARFALGTVS